MNLQEPHVIYTSKTGRQIKGYSVTSLLTVYRGEFGKLMNPAAVNSAIRLALYRGGEMFINVFLPKRFDPTYARNALGYRSDAAYDAWKAVMAQNGNKVSFTSDYAGFTPSTGDKTSHVMSPQPTPFVFTGHSKELVLSTARVNVIATSTRARLEVKVSVGSIAFTKQYSAFKVVTAIELGRVSEVIEKTLREELLPKAQTGQLKNERFTTYQSRTPDISTQRSMPASERSL